MADTASSPPPSRPQRASTNSGGSCLDDWLAPRSLYAIALSVAWVLSVIGATEPVWEEYRGSQHVKQTLWQACYDSGLEAGCHWGEYAEAGGCTSKDIMNKYRAGRAFGTLVCLFLSVIAIVAIARAMLPNVDLHFSISGSLSGRIYFWSLAITTFFCFLAWPIVFSLYAGSRCDGLPSVSSLQYSVLGSCGLFFLNVFIILMICLLAECLKGKGVLPAEDYPALA